MRIAPRWSAALLSVMLVLFILPLSVSAKVGKDLKAEVQPQIELGLESDDPLVKSYAILAAGQLGDKKLNAKLTPFLESTNRQVRQAAIVALASRKDRKALAALNKEIQGASAGRYLVLSSLMPRLPEKVRMDALKKLGFGKKADPTTRDLVFRYISEVESGKIYGLLGQVVKAKGDTRAAFLKALTRYPRKEALPWAKKMLGDKRNAAARLEGLKLAQAIGGAEVDGMMRKALADEDAKMVEVAFEYLSKANDAAASKHLVSKLQNTPAGAGLQELVEEVLATNVKVPLEVANKLIAADKGADEKLSLSLYALLGATQDKDAFTQLSTLEQSTLIEERRRGVYGLGYTRNPKALPILARTINDGNSDLRLYSAQGLGVMAMPQGVDALQKTLNRSPRGDMKYALLHSLGQIKSENAANALMFKASDPDPKVKKLVLDGLTFNGGERTSSILEVMVNDPDKELRWKATMLMLKLDKTRGMSYLGRALQRPPEDYVDQVVALPKELRNEILNVMLRHKEQKLRTDALDALLLMGEEGVQLMRTLVTSKDVPKEVTDYCVDALLQRSDDKDLGFFKRMAQAGSDDEKIRAIEWLHRKSSQKTSGFFRTLMNGARGEPAQQMAALYGLLKSENS